METDQEFIQFLEKSVDGFDLQKHNFVMSLVERNPKLDSDFKSVFDDMYMGMGHGNAMFENIPQLSFLAIKEEDRLSLTEVYNEVLNMYMSGLVSHSEIEIKHLSNGLNENNFKELRRFEVLIPLEDYCDISVLIGKDEADQKFSEAIGSCIYEKMQELKINE